MVSYYLATFQISAPMSGEFGLQFEEIELAIVRGTRSAGRSFAEAI